MIQDTSPLSYPKIQFFFKLTPDMFTTSKTMQSGTLTICKYVFFFIYIEIGFGGDLGIGVF